MIPLQDAIVVIVHIHVLRQSKRDFSLSAIDLHEEDSAPNLSELNLIGSGLPPSNSQRSHNPQEGPSHARGTAHAHHLQEGGHLETGLPPLHNIVIAGHAGTK